MIVSINIYFIIILVVMIAGFILDFVATRLNLRTFSPRVPEEFKTVYSEEKYKESQEYTRANTAFSQISGTFSFVVVLVFWLLGGFGFADQMVRNLGYGPVISGLLFFALLGVANYVISLPFSVYHTFVLEEKFGFNRTTVKTFILDQLKGTLLAVIIGGILTGAILWIFNEAGEKAWIYAALTSIAFIFIMQAIAPTWIMPLFNKFTPLEDGDLKSAIEQFAQKVKFPLTGIFVMDGSKRSAKSNAFFTGFGKNKRIALFDTLIEKHTVAELTGVLAHEIGHYKKKHIQVGMIVSILETALMFFLFSLFLNNRDLSMAFAVTTPSVYTSLIFFAMLYSPISMLLSLLGNIHSRHNEYQADHFAVANTGEPEEMINALKKLSVDNLSNLTPHPFYVFVNYSHPPVLKRIEAIRNIQPDIV